MQLSPQPWAATHSYPTARLPTSKHGHVVLPAQTLKLSPTAQQSCPALKTWFSLAINLLTRQSWSRFEARTTGATSSKTWPSSAYHTRSLLARTAGCTQVSRTHLPRFNLKSKLRSLRWESSTRLLRSGWLVTVSVEPWLLSLFPTWKSGIITRTSMLSSRKDVLESVMQPSVIISLPTITSLLQVLVSHSIKTLLALILLLHGLLASSILVMKHSTRFTLIPQLILLLRNLKALLDKTQSSSLSTYKTIWDTSTTSPLLADLFG